MVQHFSEDGRAVCQLCGKSFHVITPKHLERKHDTTVKLYREQFPEFPIVSKQFMAKQQRQRSTLFQGAEEEKKKEVEEVLETIRRNEDFIEEDKPEVKPEIAPPIEEDDTRVPTIEELDFEKEVIPAPEDEIEFMETSPQEKIDIVRHLKGVFPHMRNNFAVVKKSLHGNIDYQLITDMADPVIKVVFSFPRSFWHNESLDFNRVKEYLIADGWYVVVINSRNPSIRDVEKVLESTDLISKVEQNINYKEVKET